MPGTHRRRAVAVAVMLLSPLCAEAAAAPGNLSVRLTDRDGAPVPEVAVYVTPISISEPAAAAEPSATVNQHNLSFDPHVSIVETGTAVHFLNEDEVGHHVYSFSPAKQLNMQLTSGEVRSPQVFDRDGLVTLGCNIHDQMLAYILVVATPYFGKTDAGGAVEIRGLPSGRYELGLWTPRLKSQDLPAAQVIEIRAGAALAIERQLEARLLPPHGHSETSLKWEQY